MDWPVGGFMENRMFSLKRLKIQLADTQLKHAQLKLARTLQSFRPSHQLPVTIVNKGGHWVCKFECSSEPMENAIAFGDSPEQACLNFDALWNGQVPILNDNYEEEEEQF
jgi:hypothetical protein